MRMPQVDVRAGVYGSKLVKWVIEQSGMTREQFYASTKASAAKINVLPATDQDLKGWAS